MDRFGLLFLPCVLIISGGYAQWPVPFPPPASTGGGGSNPPANPANPADFLTKGKDTLTKSGENAAGSGSTQFGAQMAHIPGAANYTKQIGAMECTGVDKLTGVPVATFTAGKGVEHSGDHLCTTTCGGGCTPSGMTAEKDAPPSISTFDCKCLKDRCTGGRPNPKQLENSNAVATAAYKIICNYDGRCGCKGMDPEDKSAYRVGYICNFLNYNAPPNSTSTDPKEEPKAKFSGLRWCSCCPG